MPDASLKIKAGADFKDLKDGVNDAKRSLTDLKKDNAELKVEVDRLNKSLSENDRALSGTRKALKIMKPVADQNKEAVRKLNAELAKLKAQNVTLKSSLGSAKAELAKSTKAIENQGKALKKTTPAYSKALKGFKKFYSVIRTAANILPAAGISTILLLIAGPIIRAFKKWFGATKAIVEQQKALKEGIKSATESISKEAAQVSVYVATASNLNNTQQQRIDAIKELQKLAPETFGNLDTEKLKVSDLNESYKLYLKSLRSKITLEANQKALESGTKSRLDLEKKLNDEIKERDRLQKDIRENPFIQGPSSSTAPNLNIDTRVSSLFTSEHNISKYKRQLKELDESNKSFLKSLSNPKALNSAQKIYKKLSEGIVKVRNEEDAFGITAETTSKKIGLIRTAIADLMNVSGLNKESPLVQNLLAMGNALGGFDKKATAANKSASGLEDTLAAMNKELAAIAQREIFFKVDLDPERIKVMSSVLKNLFDKFGLKADNPLILKLGVEIEKLNLKNTLKDAVKQGQIKALEVPIKFQKPSDSEIKRIIPDYDKIFSNQRMLAEIKRRRPNMTGVETIQFKEPTEAAKEYKAILQSINEEDKKMADTISGFLSPALDDIFSTLVDGGNAFTSVGQAIEKMIKQLIVAAAKAAVLAAILSAITPGVSFGGTFKGLLGFKDGGLVHKADGGYISGRGTSRSDSIPAMLSNGEYVMKASAVQKFGKAFFDNLNTGIGMPSTNKFAEGGYVRAGAIDSPSSGVFVSGEFKLRNKVLVAAVRRGEKERGRMT